jgi:hypothetical protein
MGTHDLIGKRRLLFNYSRAEPVQRLSTLRIDTVADASVPLLPGRGFDMRIVEHEDWFAFYAMFSVGHFTPDNAALLLDQFMAILIELIEGVPS